MLAASARALLPLVRAAPRAVEPTWRRAFASSSPTSPEELAEFRSNVQVGRPRRMHASPSACCGDRGWRCRRLTRGVEDGTPAATRVGQPPGHPGRRRRAPPRLAGVGGRHHHAGDSGGG